MIVLARLKEVFDYNPETGIFIRIKTVGKRTDLVGTIAGSKMKIGYLAIGIDERTYYAHRLAWFYMTGKWPKYIDHINGIRTDNRFSNLRLATNSQNCANRAKQSNNTSGHKGVFWHKKARKWMVSIEVEGKQIYCGLFVDFGEACAAYAAAETRYFGEFAYTQRSHENLGDGFRA